MLGRIEKPVAFFGLFTVLFLAMSLGLSLDLLFTYWQTHLVPRVPTAILCTGLALLGIVSLSCGLILDTVTRGRREVKRLAYLAQRPPGV